jgi:putative transposase
MPRKTRLFLPNQPQHIVVRGHNRDPIVARRIDYQTFVEFLNGAMTRYDLALHAWVLMTNHIHLLVTPGEQHCIPRAMQWLGAHYAQYFNKCYRRRGSLWEGRYKVSLVDTDRYLLLCYRYIEMNPVRAGMVATPGAYPWSSYRQNAGIEAEGVGANAPTPDSPDSTRGVRAFALTPEITPHALFLALGQTNQQRQKAYRALFDEILDRKTLTEFRRGMEKQRPVGNPGFLLRVARMRGT